MTAVFDAEPIRYEGPESENPLAFRWYDPDREVLGRRMEDHLRFAVAYWHSFATPGADPFGPGTWHRPWQARDDMAHAEAKLAAAFEFFTKLGVPFFCFHDVDAIPGWETVAEGRSHLDHIAALMEERMQQTGVRLLWGTANLFSHPRYMAGAATNPDPDIFAFACGQVRNMLETTHRLGGANYVLWGGREGYETLLNTDLRQEQEQMARFLSMVIEHKHRIGFEGQILIEPKPQEPTKHQYDRDAAAVHAFLRRYDLVGEIRLNIEVNHATLAGLPFEHEVAYAAANGLLGSFDINRGDPQCGWDTDQFPNDPKEVALALLHVLRAGGLSSGGFNFDAKLRRQSVDLIDLMYAHVGGMDTVARGLLIAERILDDGRLDEFVRDRYAGWNGDEARAILQGERSLAEVADAASETRPRTRSGRQEYLENLVNQLL